MYGKTQRELQAKLDTSVPDKVHRVYKDLQSRQFRKGATLTMRIMTTPTRLERYKTLRGTDNHDEEQALLEETSHCGHSSTTYFESNIRVSTP
jgi:hypothetical protein